MIGKMVNERYKVIDKLGGGGMSIVYLAEDTILNRKVAIKAISIPPREKEETLKRFEREVHNSSQLSHENIVSMIDVDEEDECFYLVMEYIEGPTLAEYIHSHGSLSVETAIKFTEQILSGIKHAHDMRIVHRDIKPQNVLIDKNKTLKIFDFGIAKALSETSLTQTNHVLGTVQYLSPEQAKGESTDEGTDIYSIGIVLYEMLVGEPPFNGETAVSIAIKHIQDSIPNITTDKREEVPHALSNVVLRATEKDKHNRYHTVQEMCDDLTSALHENRANEEKYELDKTKTVPLTKDELNKKINDTHNDDDLNKTMQIPIVNEPVRQQEFQSLEGRYSSPPKKKHSKMKITVLSLIFALLLAGLVGFIGMGVFGSKYEEMPDLSGKTEKEAEQILKDHHLTMGDISRKYSDKYPENQIIKSEPNSGERIEEGEAIDIILSKGPQKVKMPNLVGLPKDEAVKKLKNLGLKDIDVEQAYSHSVDKGLISEQSVEANSEVALNDHHIKIYESLGVRQVYVSDFENKSYSSAKKELESKGFKVQATQENDDKVKKGNIISQSPKNKSVDEGSIINLTVSKGKSGEDDDDSDDSDVKSTSETVKVPYSGSKGKSQTVEVFIRDKDNSGNSASQTFKITKDKTISIPLKIEKGKTAGYTVRVDNKIVADKDVGYDD
ncbi:MULTISPECIES: Stk1 family PASTA domain-containing Ser/Thr kinase [Staphylococcus]|uniref:Serine/threonine-protein kinase PrkC n=1 Tax=Staphylococcus capitis TaxID=29388 RepID=A0A7Z8E3N0_STACP|nr:MULTISPECIES: Stk1 family PASTA domain-containing Ser/Thr kinase [Staphylococcus]MBC8780840.1 Stk1 family PASTA domain-containing Ser/Thr kinase [Staphylococcus capitis]MBE7321233.1 Stk1 family PASTA domain-containing Ser/Thr kinase [Staphylococcus capitis]MBU5290704.1 Stk1 family PASTA domain-containing Ser/Thr kinase [Staphylococcus capitis]MCC3689663.1 Stk1 family PASTA domain-containing Ser/Thr kinase [Staphylococcus capitis]MCC3695214.1 Stk1 family PASTA domain-containing Ser/Thr kinas